MRLHIPWGGLLNNFLNMASYRPPCAFFRQWTLIHFRSMAVSSSKFRLPGAGVGPSPDME
eukprot:12880871-Prorocentrum_lima.AAC.1